MVNIAGAVLRPENFLELSLYLTRPYTTEQKHSPRNYNSPAASNTSEAVNSFVEMFSRSSSSRRSRDNGSSSAKRSLQIFPPERRHTDLVRRQGGLISVPKTLSSAPLMVPVTDGTQKLTKLLLKVHIEGSLGPVHVVLPPESTVSDLIKAATETHVKEKRRPLLKESDPNSFQLHYSQFSLESLRPEEKLINLGSRNFFLCSRPPASSANSRSSDEAEKASQFHLSLTKLTEFLL